MSFSTRRSLWNMLPELLSLRGSAGTARRACSCPSACEKSSEKQARWSTWRLLFGAFVQSHLYSISALQTISFSFLILTRRCHLKHRCTARARWQEGGRRCRKEGAPAPGATGQEAAGAYEFAPSVVSSMYCPDSAPCAQSIAPVRGCQVFLFPRRARPLAEVPVCSWKARRARRRAPRRC